MIIFRTGRWRLQRIIVSQIGWDAKRHKPIYKHEVTISNGAFISYGRSRYVIIAWLRAHLNRRSALVLKKDVKSPRIGGKSTP